MSYSRFLPFEEARKYSRSLKLSSVMKWGEFTKLSDFPYNIPKRPEGKYKNQGWDGYSDWLGTGNGKYLTKGKGRLSFKEAHQQVLKLKIVGLNGWITYCKSGKRPANIPASPHTSYKGEGWEGYGHWTGTGRVRRTKFLPFEEAREYARSLNLFSQTSWEKFVKSDKRPKNIPSQPDYHYKKEWQGFKDWLKESNTEFSKHLVSIETEISSELDSAIDNLKSRYLPYEKARDYVRKLGLKGQKEWFVYAKSKDRPANIPHAPYQKYAEWTGFADWLGTTRTRPTNFLPFEEVRTYVRSLKIEGIKEWQRFVLTDKKPIGIPAQPDQYFIQTGEWTNWYDFLGMVRGNSGQGAAVRRIISRFQELEKRGNSLKVIMDKLSEEFPRQSESKIREILLKWAETQSDR